MVLAQKQTHRSMEQDRKPRNKPMHLLIYDKGGKNIIQWRKKTVSLISGDGKTGQLHVKRRKLEHSLTPCTKINSKWIKDLNVKTRYYKTPRGKHKQNTL